MGGKFSINGKDAFNTFGVFLGGNSIDALLTPPSAKKRISNESRLLPGIQVIDYKNVPQSRDITLVFYFKGKDYSNLYSMIEAFIQELMNGITTFVINELPLVKFKLDFESSSPIKQINGKLAKISLKFTEPNPNDRS